MRWLLALQVLEARELAAHGAPLAMIALQLGCTVEQLMKRRWPA